MNFVFLQVWFQNRRMKDKRQKMTLAWPCGDPVLAAYVLQQAAAATGLQLGGGAACPPGGGPPNPGGLFAALSAAAAAASSGSGGPFLHPPPPPPHHPPTGLESGFLPRSSLPPQQVWPLTHFLFAFSFKKPIHLLGGKVIDPSFGRILLCFVTPSNFLSSDP